MAAYKSTYTKVFEKNKYDIRIARRSWAWFQGQVKNLADDPKINAPGLINARAEKNRQAGSIVPGEMYLFRYDAKHKDTLPYWDQFPLIFPFRKVEDGFYGLNMHYLHYRIRIILLDRLMDFRTNSKLDERTKLKFSWQLISGLSRYELAKPTVHRYLTKHVKSPLKKIDSDDWVTAMMLPVESFQNASKEDVWKITGRGLMGTRA